MYNALKSKEALLFVEGHSSLLSGGENAEMIFSVGGKDFSYEDTLPGHDDIASLARENAWIKIGYFKEELPIKIFLVETKDAVIVSPSDATKYAIKMVTIFAVIGCVAFFFTALKPAQYLRKKISGFFFSSPHEKTVTKKKEKKKEGTFWRYFMLLISLLLFMASFLYAKDILVQEEELEYLEGVPSWSVETVDVNGGIDLSFRIEDSGAEFEYPGTAPNYGEVARAVGEKKWIRIGYLPNSAPLKPFSIETEEGGLVSFGDSQVYALTMVPFALVMGILFFLSSDTSPARYILRGIRKSFPKKRKGIIERNSKVILQISNLETPIFVVLGSSFFVLLGIFFLMIGGIGFVIVAWLCLPFFGYALLLFLPMLRKKPLVKITKEGIYGYGGNISFSFVAWEEITDIDWSGIVSFNTKYNGKILLRGFPWFNPLNWIVRLLSWGNTRKTFGFYPFNIHTSLFGISQKELQEIIERYSGKTWRKKK